MTGKKGFLKAFFASKKVNFVKYEEQKEDFKYMQIIGARYREHILEGRNLHGEPEDLNF